MTLAGYVLAALFAGLWWGELQRRKDAQDRASGFEPRGHRPPRASVADPVGNPAYQVENAMSEAEDTYVREVMAEGFSESEARASWAKIQGQLVSSEPEGASWP